MGDEGMDTECSSRKIVSIVPNRYDGNDDTNDRSDDSTRSTINYRTSGGASKETRKEYGMFFIHIVLFLVLQIAKQNWNGTILRTWTLVYFRKGIFRYRVARSS